MGEGGRDGEVEEGGGGCGCGVARDGTGDMCLSGGHPWLVFGGVLDGDGDGMQLLKEYMYNALLHSTARLAMCVILCIHICL